MFDIPRVKDETGIVKVSVCINQVELASYINRVKEEIGIGTFRSYLPRNSFKEKRQFLDTSARGNSSLNIC